MSPLDLDLTPAEVELVAGVLTEACRTGAAHHVAIVCFDPDERPNPEITMQKLARLGAHLRSLNRPPKR